LDPVEKTFRLPGLSANLTAPRIKEKEVANFASDLSDMLSSGIVLISALQLIQQTTANSALKKIVADIIDTIHGGKPFSGAIQKHPEVFPETYFQVIRASEKSGNLELGLKYLASYANRQIELKKRFKQVFNYPIIILSLAILIGGFLVTKVLPIFVDMFDKVNGNLPLITKLTMGFSSFLINNIFFLFLGLLIIGAVIFMVFRTKSGKMTLSRFMLKIPVVGELMLRLNLLTYSHMASMLLRSGLLLPNVTYFCAQTVKNVYVREALMGVHTSLVQGHSLSATLRGTNLFDPVSLEKIQIGEKTGDVNQAFANISESSEKVIDEKIKSLLALIEPAIIVGIALVVGLLALSIITPMYSLLGSFE
jgi:type IV pilus assembly protein PilC